MFNSEMVALGTQRSVIREIFEYGNQRAKEVGRENVLDFSIGNPNVPAPPQVQEAIRQIMDEMDPTQYHSYTSSPGLPATRDAIAQNLNQRFGTNYVADDVYMACGAAACLNISIKALTASEEDEFVAITPFFPEYRFFVQAHGGRFVIAQADPETFQIDFDNLAKALNKNTKALIINTPNNPSGVAYTPQTMEALAKLLEEKSREYGHPIYIISDEPYRELVYGDTKPMLTASYYDNTIINYSWSKSLSLPGERIGYILVPGHLEGAQELKAAMTGAARILGFVCAPSLFQQVVARCVDVEPNLDTYITNRNLLLDNLTKFGYEMATPDGAFYAFIKSPSGDSKEFCDRAKAHDLLLVPGDGFGVPSHMRMSYCVSTDSIKKSLPIFEKLMAQYKEGK